MIRRLPTVTFDALGTTAVVVGADMHARTATAAEAVREELDDIDRTCSRFRTDSDITRVNDAAGSWVDVDPLLVQAVDVALRAADLTDGLVDLTVGGSMVRLGYDRDFAAIVSGNGADPAWLAAPGWRLVETRTNPPSVRLAPGVSIDLGSTAKALAADRAAVRAAEASGAGVLVSLGGDIAVAGDAPEGGWPVGIAEDHEAPAQEGETISIESGGVATSSITVRRWTRGANDLHHILDPRSGRPADGEWRTVTVAAASCVDANIASTASIVAGADDPGWLERRGLPARLVRRDGTVLRLGGWPEAGAA